MINREWRVGKEEHVCIYIYLCIEMEAIVSFPVVKVVGSEMLAASGHLQHGVGPAVGLLKASYVTGRVFSSNKWVLSRGLLSSAPPGVPKYVDVGAPIRQPTHASIIHRTRLI